MLQPTLLHESETWIMHNKMQTNIDFFSFWSRGSHTNLHAFYILAGYIINVLHKQTLVGNQICAVGLSGSVRSKLRVSLHTVCWIVIDKRLSSLRHAWKFPKSFETVNHHHNLFLNCSLKCYVGEFEL